MLRRVAWEIMPVSCNNPGILEVCAGDMKENVADETWGESRSLKVETFFSCYNSIIISMPTNTCLLLLCHSLYYWRLANNSLLVYYHIFRNSSYFFLFILGITLPFLFSLPFGMLVFPLITFSFLFSRSLGYYFIFVFLISKTFAITLRKRDWFSVGWVSKDKIVDERTANKCQQNPFIGALGIQEPVILGEPQI